MDLYEVNVIDGSTPRSPSAKVFVQTYATIAETPLEAAQKVARENTVDDQDRVVAQKVEGLTVHCGSHRYFPRQIEQRVVRDGSVFTGSTAKADRSDR